MIVKEKFGIDGEATEMNLNDRSAPCEEVSCTKDVYYGYWAGSYVYKTQGNIKRIRLPTSGCDRLIPGLNTTDIERTVQPTHQKLR